MTEFASNILAFHSRLLGSDCPEFDVMRAVIFEGDRQDARYFIITPRGCSCAKT
jgi:hypothetical protein